MKKLVIFLLNMITAIHFVFSYTNEKLDIVLEYKTPKEIEYVFSKATTVALKVEEIIADGQPVVCFDDIRDISVSEIEYEKKRDDNCFVNMTWYHQQNYYVWNDGRGIIFVEGENGYYIPKTNSYRIPVNTKKLTIKYRVLLPCNNIDKNELLNSFPDNGIYSQLYVKEIYINKIKR